LSATWWQRWWDETGALLNGEVGTDVRAVQRLTRGYRQCDIGVSTPVGNGSDSCVNGVVDRAIRAVDSVSGRGTSTASTWATDTRVTEKLRQRVCSEVERAADRRQWPVQHDDFVGRRSDRS